jgi:hypothetical protein
MAFSASERSERWVRNIKTEVMPHEKFSVAGANFFYYWSVQVLLSRGLLDCGLMLAIAYFRALIFWNDIKRQHYALFFVFKWNRVVIE